MFKLNTSDELYGYFKNQFPFFVKWFLRIWDAQEKYDAMMAHVNYIRYWGIAESLQNTLLLAPINYGEDDNTIQKKIDFVSRYIETFTVKRAMNYRKFGQTSIRYSMFNVVKLIRGNDLNALGNNLSKEVENISESWGAVPDFGLHGMNRSFVKHLLSRISSYLDNLVGKDTTYMTYYHPNGKQFEIEHIWADKFEEHKDEFDQKNDFQKYRNSIGALVLLPTGTNQSFKSDKYEDKIDHYLKENTYAQTLNKDYYLKNPNFLNSEIIKRLGFQPHPQFKKADIMNRQKLVQRICERIWSVDYYK